MRETDVVKSRLLIALLGVLFGMVGRVVLGPPDEPDPWPPRRPVVELQSSDSPAEPEAAD